MTFKETKGDRTVEACVLAAPGRMFKGYIRVSIKRGQNWLIQTTGKGCGRPVSTFDAAMELATAEARRVLAR